MHCNVCYAAAIPVANKIFDNMGEQPEFSCGVMWIIVVDASADCLKYGTQKIRKQAYMHYETVEVARFNYNNIIIHHVNVNVCYLFTIYSWSEDWRINTMAYPENANTF